MQKQTQNKIENIDEQTLAYGRMRLNASGWKEIDIHNDYLPLFCLPASYLCERPTEEEERKKNGKIERKKQSKTVCAV